MSDEFERIVDVLEGAPSEECVIRNIFLEDLGIDPLVLARASGRPVRSAIEYSEHPERNMQLRDKVFVFGRKETA